MSHRKVLGELSIIVAAAFAPDRSKQDRDFSSHRPGLQADRSRTAAVVANPDFDTTITTGSTAQALAQAMVLRPRPGLRRYEVATDVRAAESDLRL